MIKEIIKGSIYVIYYHSSWLLLAFLFGFLLRLRREIKRGTYEILRTGRLNCYEPEPALGRENANHDAIKEVIRPEFNGELPKAGTGADIFFTAVLIITMIFLIKYWKP